VVAGQVQGLGFRPWAFRTAVRLGLTGFVVNTTSGVVVVVQGRRRQDFVRALRQRPPRLAEVRGLRVTATRARPLAGFRILPSRRARGAGTDVLPDLATCRACRRETFDPGARRRGYPFTNCTRCGPRYSIVTGLPYDRPNTTMAGFEMCAACRAEYANPADRRFHAQPIACPVCGPRLALDGGHALPAPLSAAARAIVRGRVVAVKGIGGFHLVCDAASSRAVGRLRRCKERGAKPLALMCANLAAARLLCLVSRTEAAHLCSPAAPIVLLRRKPGPAAVADAVAPGNGCLGVMLPYSPLHMLLFDELRRLGWDGPALVATSANRKDEPLAATEDELRRLPAGAADLVLTHDRPIANRCDDSVVFVPADVPIIVRRSRGYAPQPVRLAAAFHVKHPVLAVGADGRNAFAIAAGDRVFISPHVGSVEPGPSETFFRSALARLAEWTRQTPTRVVCDLHPDYWSTRLAEKLAREYAVPLLRCQHHYCHALSVLAEHGVAERVLALVADGAGYGTDGKTWGCEFLLVERDLSWRRVGHLGELLCSGSGDELADPSRVAAEYLEQVGMDDARARLGLGRAVVGAGGTPTSSLGRLFDAAAAITGICRHATFSGQAAMALEAAAMHAGSWSAATGAPKREAAGAAPLIISPRPLLVRLAELALSGTPGPVAAYRFHEEVLLALVGAALALARRHRVRVICLSGGSFLNRFLHRGMLDSGLTVLTNRQVSPGDGGIALGQALAGSR